MLPLYGSRERIKQCIEFSYCSGTLIACMNLVSASCHDSKPIARVAPVVARRIVLLLAQMIAHLGLQSPLQDGFGELFEQTVFPDDILGLLVVGQQLVDQLHVDGHGFSYFQLPMTVYTVLFTPFCRQ
jgi:hypothetical protein